MKTAAAIAWCSSAPRTTDRIRISDGNWSFLTSVALSVMAVAERCTPSWTAVHGSRPQKRKIPKLSVPAT